MHAKDLVQAILDARAAAQDPARIVIDPEQPIGRAQARYADLIDRYELRVSPDDWAGVRLTAEDVELGLDDARTFPIGLYGIPVVAARHCGVLAT